MSGGGFVRVGAVSRRRGRYNVPCTARPVRPVTVNGSPDERSSGRSAVANDRVGRRGRGGRCGRGGPGDATTHTFVGASSVLPISATPSPWAHRPAIDTQG